MLRAGAIAAGIATAALLAAPMAGADPVDGGRLTVTTSKSVVKLGDRYTITVRGRTPAGSTRVRVSLTYGFTACPATRPPSLDFEKSPAAGSFRYPDPFVDVDPIPGVRLWCAYATFATASGTTAQLHASVRQTFRARRRAFDRR